MTLQLVMSRGWKSLSLVLLSVTLAVATIGVCPARGEGSSGLPPPAVSIEVVGGDVTVFRKSADTCDPDDIPDAPARALRLADGSVALFAANQKNRVFRGTDLLSVHFDCTVVFTGKGSADPAEYDDRLWLASPWLLKDGSIAALVHSEYQGNTHPGHCPTGRYLDCWYNAITLAISRDATQSFARAQGASALVASAPYRFDPAAHQPVGYFNPSNLVERDGLAYAMIWARPYRAQAGGNCLIRAQRPEQPASWRAWDGTGFDVRFINPYQDSAAPEEHVCQPVAHEQLAGPVVSLVRHGGSGAYIALFVSAREHGDTRLPWAVFAAGSWDLIHWSVPRAVIPVARFDTVACDAPSPLAYPSLLDPHSPSPNFDIVGDTAQLFLTRFNIAACRTSLDRDLIRIPVQISVNGK